MRWGSPFDNFSKAARIRLIVITFVMSAILLIVLRTLDAPLRTEAAPKGIVSFELAKDYEASRHILSSWDAEAKVYAALSLGLDYLFLIVYALFISLACIRVAEALNSDYLFFFILARVLAWSQFLAAVLDALENMALIQLLLNSSRSWLPVLARWGAMVKFGIVGAGLIFIFGGLLAIGIKKRLK
jgi:hypothetical protein